MAFESYKRDEERFQNCLIYVCFLSIAEYTILQERIAIHLYPNEQYVLAFRYSLDLLHNSHKFRLGLGKREKRCNTVRLSPPAPKFGGVRFVKVPQSW